MASLRADRIRRGALGAFWLILLLLPSRVPAQGTGDTTVSQLKARLRETHPLFRQGRAALELAIVRREAAGLRSPASVSADIEEVPSGFNVLSARSIRVDLSQELAPAGIRSAERAVADVDISRAREELDLTARTIDLTVDQLVASAAAYDAIASRLASEDSVLRGAEEALRARFAVADARYVDVLRLRTERLRVETELQRSRFESRVRLRQLVRLATPADSALVLKLALEAIARSHAGLRTSTTTLPSPDSIANASGVLRLADLAVSRAEAERRLVRSQQRGAITPSLGVQRFGEADGPTRLGLTAGFSMALPFTAPASARARLASADREVILARVRRDASSELLMTGLVQARERFELARLQLTTFDGVLLQGLREEREAALSAYRTGSMSLMELLDFERAMAQADVSRLRAQLDAHDALYEYLALALGTDVGGAR
jgi:outer membrane protein TolC